MSKIKRRGRPKKIITVPEELPEYVCEQCGKLHRVNNKYKLKVRKYCSISCANAARAFVGPQFPKPPRKKSEAQYTTIVCLQCGTEHKVQKSMAKRGQKFCSNRCQMLYKYKDHIHYRTRDGVKKECFSSGVNRGRTAGFKAPPPEYTPNAAEYFKVQKVTSLAGELWTSFHVASLCEYHISNMGRVKSVRTDNGMERIIQQQWIQHDPGRWTWQCTVGKRPGSRFSTHRLVAQYFVPNTCGYKLTEFIDGNPRNVLAANICWGRKEVAGLTKADIAKNFETLADTKSAHPEIACGVAKYIVSNDRVALNTAWGVAMITLRRVVRNHLCKHTNRLPSQELISDVVAETLLKAQSAIDAGRLRTPDNIEGWLAQIARNTAITYGKKNHHITVNRHENRNSEEFSLYDLKSQDEYAYTPQWGHF